jgi:hypothetical protein
MSDTERQVEVPWMLEQVVGGVVLDIGSMDSRYLDDLAERAGELWLADPRLTAGPLPQGIFVFTGRGDQLPAEWAGKFNTVVSVSTLDHIGLNAYGQTAVDGMLEDTVASIARVTRAGGKLIITVPFGRDHVTLHPGGDQRVFDRASLRRLFSPGQWQWQDVAFWKLEQDKYISAAEEDVTGAEYAGWRAGAVVGLTLVRVAPVTKRRRLAKGSL